jgi:hypothetical protein
MDLVETARGKVYSCECGKVIRLVPKKEEDDEPEARLVATPSVADRDDEEVRIVRRPPRPKRIVRRPKENLLVEQWNYWAGALGGLAYVLLGVTAIWLLGFCLTVAFPPAFVGLLFLGFGLSIAGHIWLLVVAFQDSPTSGMLCLLIGLYALVYAIMNLGETWRALLLQVLGFFVIISAFLGAAIGGVLFYR